MVTINIYQGDAPKQGADTQSSAALPASGTGAGSDAPAPTLQPETLTSENATAATPSPSLQPPDVTASSQTADIPSPTMQPAGASTGMDFVGEFPSPGMGMPGGASVENPFDGFPPEPSFQVDESTGKLLVTEQANAGSETGEAPKPSGNRPNAGNEKKSSGKK